MRKEIRIITKGRYDIAKDLVSKYLEEKKYLIIEKTFEFRRQKVDLIIYDEKTKELVFVEIKIYNIPNIYEEIEEKRKEFLKAAAKNYNYEYGLYDIPVRFDKVELFLNNSMYKIRYIKKFMV